MVKLDEHPTVRAVRERLPRADAADRSSPLDADWVRRLCLEAGADDVGLVEIDRPELAEDRSGILATFPHAKSLVSFVCRMNREPIRSPARSVANLEFHHTGDRVNDVARLLVAALERCGIRAMNPSMGFPMEMDRFPGKIWVLSHKLAAVAAGLGRMGVHRNVIHPKFGSFVLLGTVLIDAVVSRYDRPLDYNPCLECKLCVAACPTGAIGADGAFDFSACYTHNYREFMGGFTDWVERIADSCDAKAYRRRVSDAESASMWQSLSFGANYKAAYCLAVCPAGEEVIPPYLDDSKRHVDEVVKPLQRKPETIYVVAGSDAEGYVARRFPQKRLERVGNGLRPSSVGQFLTGLPNVFQRGRSAGLDATYHFTFTGEEPGQATVTICDKTILVQDGHSGQANVRITADSRTWLRFVRKEGSLVWALLTRRIRVSGPPTLLIRFSRCFPS
ncbi:MAG TPA: SCP2 sterol-binding domain-containing protein [Nitrospiraceae bacterium]|jgi:Fe-S-cluster-containing hydrogenase component 2|nr:SCP2 sterol-binding domain-containing protein [Nitrospiraceae bacterium]